MISHVRNVHCYSDGGKNRIILILLPTDLLDKSKLIRII